MTLGVGPLGRTSVSYDHLSIWYPKAPIIQSLLYCREINANFFILLALISVHRYSFDILEILRLAWRNVAWTEINKVFKNMVDYKEGKSCISIHINRSIL